MISPPQRPLPDNTQNSQQTDIHAPGGIRTHNLSRRGAADLRLRPRGHWDRQLVLLLILKSHFLFNCVFSILFHVITCEQTHSLNSFRDLSMFCYRINIFKTSDKINSMQTLISRHFSCTLSPWRYTTHIGCVFYSPLSGFSLLAYEVTWSHTATRHSQ